MDENKSWQIELIEYLANPIDDRSITQFCKDVDISRETYYRFCRQNRVEINAEVDRVRKTYVSDLRREAFKGLGSRLRKSDKAIQMGLEITGDYIPKSEQKVEYTTPEQKREKLRGMMEEIRKKKLLEIKPQDGMDGNSPGA